MRYRLPRAYEIAKKTVLNVLYRKFVGLESLLTTNDDTVACISALVEDDDEEFLREIASDTLFIHQRDGLTPQLRSLSPDRQIRFAQLYNQLPRRFPAELCRELTKDEIYGLLKDCEFAKWYEAYVVDYGMVKFF